MSGETPDALASVPTWFKHLSATMDQARVDTLRACIEGLGDSELSVPDLPLLVRAAHRQTSAEDLEKLDDKLSGCAPTYSADRNAEELQTICAAALVVAMSKQSKDESKQARTRAVRAALLVESAGFVGREPVLSELRVASRACLEESSRRARQRLSNDVAARAVTKLTKLPTAEEATPDPVRMYELIVQRDSTLAALAGRLETLVGAFNSRLDLMDEEIDVLWWARSGLSRTTGKPWASMTPLNRAILAGSEVAHLTKHFPATLGTHAVLASVASAGGETSEGSMQGALEGSAKRYEFVDVLEAIDELGVKLVEADGDPFLPLASGLAQLRRYTGDAAATAAAIQAERLVADQLRVTCGQVAEQVLRERAIEALS